MKNCSYQWLLRISAVLIPIYMVFYGGFYERPHHPETQILKQYLVGGFVLHLGIFVFYLIYKPL